MLSDIAELKPAFIAKMDTFMSNNLALFTAAWLNPAGSMPALTPWPMKKPAEID